MAIPGGEWVGGGPAPRFNGGWRGLVVGTAASAPGGDGTVGFEAKTDVAVDETVVAGARKDEVVGLASGPAAHLDSTQGV